MFVWFSNIAVWCRYFVNIVHLCVGVCVNSGSFDFWTCKKYIVPIVFSIFITWYRWPWSIPYHPTTVWCGHPTSIKCCASFPLLCNRSDAGEDRARLVYCQMKCVSLISVHLKTCKTQPHSPKTLDSLQFIFLVFWCVTEVLFLPFRPSIFIYTR